MAAIGDILVKLAEQKTLTPEEKGALRLWGNETQTLNAYTNGLQVGTSQLSGARIENPFFLSSALSFIKVQRSTNTAIVTGTDTYVSFEERGGKDGVFRWDSSDPTKIFINYPGQNFALHGVVEWEANATGYRNVKVEGFTGAGVSLGSEALHSFPGFTGSNNIMPFIGEYYTNQFTNLAYIKMTVGHTRGADLNLLNFNMGISIL